MFFGNRCGICSIFGCLCGGRRRGCGCGRERFCCEERYGCEERFERFESFGDRCCGIRDIAPFGAGRNGERELERRDFDGFFPEARFVRLERECC